MTVQVRPPFDPEIAAALDALADEVVVGLEASRIPELRARLAPPDPVSLRRDGAYEVSEHDVPVAWDGHVGRLVVVRPARAAAGVAADALVPVVYHLHGGGLVTGSPWEDLPPLVDLVDGLGVAVAAMTYRLAPEWRYPAAVEDAYAGLGWLVAHAAELGLDPHRVVVSGVSAGGGLAAATALLARERGWPTLAGQLLVYPMLDDRNDSASGHQMTGAGSWDRHANATGWAAYLGERAGGDDVPVAAAPARAGDLSGLPPTFLDVASAETFRDEDVAYAQRLWAAGADAELHVWPGGCHGFDFLVPGARVSRHARQARRRWLVRVLGVPDPEAPDPSTPDPEAPDRA